MKIALVSSTIPLVQGGGRFIVDWLAEKLKTAGHSVETIWIPYTDELKHILPQMAAFRMIELQSHFDRVITFRPPAHVVAHDQKIVWFIHHIRGFYDLWDSPYRPVPDTPYWRSFRESLMSADTAALMESKKIFTNSQVVSDRIRDFNGIDSEVLYPPVMDPQRFYCESWGSEVVCICRIEHHKRQHLLVQAMRHVRTPVRLRISGDSLSDSYIGELSDLVATHGLQNRVTIDRRWISEGEKAALLATALAAAYVAFDEDSYGYPTIEAAHAFKPTVAMVDGGGVREFIKDGETGFLLQPDPRQIADCFDRLWSDRKLAQKLGNEANQQIFRLNITWDHVLERLVA